MDENTKETNSFWNNLGTITASGLKTAGAKSLMGSVWLARQVTKGACEVGKAGKATGKAFSNEWTRQKEPQDG